MKAENFCQQPTSVSAIAVDPLEVSQEYAENTIARDNSVGL